MPMSATCRCGKRLRVKDELAGKRVKCPACGAVLPTPKSPAAKVVTLPKAPSTAASAAPEEPASHAAANQSADVAAKPPKKEQVREKRSHKVMLFVGVGAAVLLCGFGVCGFGLWYFVLKGTSETSGEFMVGKWELDAEATRSANPGKASDVRDGESSLDIRSRGSDYSIMRKYPNMGLGSTWKVVSRSGDALILESYSGSVGEQLTVSPAGVNQMRVMSNRTDPPVMVYNRK
jgi:hypothetical protein